ncbi:MAG: hypothetical protein GY855_09840 [candidate division Zixibacteria bacterium]|nr:hypothetical protein [candidate division Zixibacteria bacterium]
MKRCSKCVLPESFPGISFNSEGVCSICTGFDRQKTNKLSEGKLRDRLDEIIKESQSVNLQYDGLAAFSGGKDSTYLIYTLKKKYNLRILAFTFDNGFMPESAFTNMRNVLSKLNVDHIIFKPEQKFVNDIFKTSADKDIYPESLLKFGSAICISCIRMINNLSLKTAIEKKIPMVFLGNSPGQIIQSENEIIYRDNRIPYEFKEGLFKPLADILGEKVYNYVLLNKEDYKAKPFPYIINLFPIIGYDEDIIKDTISKLSWRRPEEVDPNTSNCQLNALGIIKHMKRLGFHPYDYEMSMLVRLGKITRDEALRRVEDPEGTTEKLAKKCQEML